MAYISHGVAIRPVFLFALAEYALLSFEEASHTALRHKALYGVDIRLYARGVVICHSAGSAALHIELFAVFSAVQRTVCPCVFCHF